MGALRFSTLEEEEERHTIELSWDGEVTELLDTAATLTGIVLLEESA